MGSSLFNNQSQRVNRPPERRDSILGEKLEVPWEKPIVILFPFQYFPQTMVCNLRLIEELIVPNLTCMFWLSTKHQVLCILDLDPTYMLVGLT